MCVLARVLNSSMIPSGVPCACERECVWRHIIFSFSIKTFSFLLFLLGLQVLFRKEFDLFSELRRVYWTPGDVKRVQEHLHIQFINLAKKVLDAVVV